MITGKEAIPTKYNGQIFKSRLESNVAYFLDCLGIKWEYEKESFLLPSGHYAPDFCCSEIKAYVEAKGVRTLKSNALCRELAEKTGWSLLYIGGGKPLIYENWPVCNTDNNQNGPVEKDAPMLVSEGTEPSVLDCGEHRSFADNTNSYHCRKCGGYKGNENWGEYISDYHFNNYDELSRELKEHGRA